MFGAIKTNCSDVDGVLRIFVEGVPSIEDYVATIQECYSKTIFKHVLWDFRESSLSGLSADGFLTIGSAGAEFAGKRGEGAKTALVVASSAEILLMDAFRAHAEIVTPIAFKGFLSEGKAMAWIRE